MRHPFHHDTAAGLLTFGSFRGSAFPSRYRLLLDEVAGLGPWSPVPDYSGGTVADFHRIPRCYRVLKLGAVCPLGPCGASSNIGDCSARVSVGKVSAATREGSVQMTTGVTALNGRRD